MDVHGVIERYYEEREQTRERLDPPIELAAEFAGRSTETRLLFNRIAKPRQDPNPEYTGDEPSGRLFYQPISVGKRAIINEELRPLYAVPFRVWGPESAEYALVFIVPDDEATPPEQLSWGRNAVYVGEGRCNTGDTTSEALEGMKGFIELLKDVAAQQQEAQIQG
jgi:hypothetical protein